MLHPCYRFPHSIGTLSDRKETDILVILMNSGFLYQLPANVPDIKSETEKEELITAYPAELKEGNYYRRIK